MSAEADDHGVALVEVLVALIIAGFVVVGLGSLLAFMVDQKARAARMLKGSEDAAVVLSVLERLTASPFADAKQFSLQSNTLRIVTLGLPQGSALAGPAVVELGPSAADKRTLVLRLPRAENDPRDVERSDQILLDNLDRLRIEIRENDRWLSDWRQATTWPNAVRVEWQIRGEPTREVAATIGPAARPVLCLREPSNRRCQT